MNAAIVDEPIRIKALTPTKTQYGTIQTSYTLKYETKASVKFNSENMTVSEGEIFYPINRTFIVRAYVPITETDRIEYKGQDYKILSINKNIYYNDIEIITTIVNT